MYWTPADDQRSSNSVILSRFGHTATVVDTSDSWDGPVVVVTGGVGIPGIEATPAVQTALSDVIVLHLQRSLWTAPEVIGPATPGPRAFHCAAAVGRYIYVFGGHILVYENRDKKRTFFNDLWQLDTAVWQWQQVVPSSAALPPKRDMSAMLALSPTQLLLFGGRNEAGRSLADTWLFDLTTKTWSPAQLEGTPPPPRRMHTMVQVGPTIVMWGGERDQGPLDDLWLLRCSPSSSSNNTLAQGGAAAGAAGSAGPSTPTAGGAGAAAGATGGSSGSGSGSGSGSAVLRWVGVKPKAGPGPRFGHAMADLPGEGQQLLLFGGCQDQSGFLSLVGRNYVQTKETWGLDLAKLSWTKLDVRSAAVPGAEGDSAASSPSPRGGTAVPGVPGAGAGSAATTPRGHSRNSSSSSLGSRTPSHPPAAAAGRGSGSGPGLVAAGSSSFSGGGPSERMCASLTRVPDGRLLLLGGRNKDGICRDHWWLQEATSISAPASPTPPTAASKPASASATPTAAAAAAAAGGPSLLLSLFSQGRSKPPVPGVPPSASSSELAAAAGAQGPPGLSPAGSFTNAAAAGITGGSATGVPGSASLTPASSMGSMAAAVTPAQPVPVPGARTGSPGVGNMAEPAAAVPLAASAPSSFSSIATAAASMMRPPVALSKLGTTVTSTMSSTMNTLLDTPGQLRGGLTQLSRLAPSFRTRAFGAAAPGTPSSGVAAAAAGAGAASSSGSGAVEPSAAAVAGAALMPLRKQMGLSAVAPNAAAAEGILGSSRESVLQELLILGRELLDAPRLAPQSAEETAAGGSSSNSAAPPTSAAGGGGGGEPQLADEVYVSAARQHLASAAPQDLQLRHLVLLWRDCQQLQQAQLAEGLLARLSEGLPQATSHLQQAAPACTRAALHLGGHPTSLKLCEVGHLRECYQQLVGA